VREWSDATGRFASPQPVAGPFLMRAGAARTGFRFYDDAGVELGDAGTGVPADRVARIRISVIAAAPGGSGASDGAQLDSLDVALQRAGTP
jgi:hypothetical protein